MTPDSIIISVQTPDGHAVAEFAPDTLDNQLTVHGEPDSTYITITFRTANGVQCGATIARKLITDLDTIA